MKKLEKRAIICLTLAAILFIGVLVFIGKFAADGDKWATFYANKHIYSEGQLNIGKIYDVNGVLLAKNSISGTKYNDDSDIRRATVHAVGDEKGNIGTSALNAFKSKLVGYNFITGTYSINGKGQDIYLSIDANINEVAYNALGGRKGTVGVYNYKTGEIVCMVSSPSFDPLDPPALPGSDTSGIYINKFLSATITPGSIFKLVTVAAAIDSKVDLKNWTYKCDGTYDVNGEDITCSISHGSVDIYGALAKSCNCAFGKLTLEIGGAALHKYVDQLGLTKSYNINGIQTAKGSFTFPNKANVNLAWAGIGQYEDQINPCSMMVYMGAIAGGGKTALPTLIHKTKNGIIPTSIHIKKLTDRLLPEDTANTIADMMKNNVKTNYGAGNYPNLDIYAKSGTAEVGRNKLPNAWFVGFIKNENYPYAFVVCVENGGTGSYVSGPIANKVLQAIIKRDN